MKKILSILTAFYGWLLCLYPRAFREEFDEEMLLDFRDMLDSASKKGIFSLSIVLSRELRDIPINLLRTHLKEGHMLKTLRSQPLNTGLRSALGFGVAFGIAAIVSGVIFGVEIDSDNSILAHLQVFYFDVFHKDSGLLFNWLFSAIGSVLTGLVLGILFAILFTDRSKYPRYILVSMLGWFLHDAVRSALAYFFNLAVFLSDWQNLSFNIMMLILSGSFLGLIFVVAKSERQGPLRLLIAGAFAYPLIAYIYVKQLFDLFVFTTPWRFVALTILWVAFLGGVFIVVAKSETGRRMLWIIVAGAFGYPIITYLVFFIAQLIFPPTPSWGINLSDHPTFWLNLAGSNAVFGILFGLLLGVALGFYKKSDLQQIRV